MLGLLELYYFLLLLNESLMTWIHSGAFLAWARDVLLLRVMNMELTQLLPNNPVNSLFFC